MWPRGSVSILLLEHDGPELLRACLPTVLPAAHTMLQCKRHMSARQAGEVGLSGRTHVALGKRHPRSAFASSSE